MTLDQGIGDVVRIWYKSTLDRDDGTARAARARLRRCDSPVDALAVAETHDLNELLKQSGRNPRPDQLALVAATFARLKGIDGDRIATLFGKQASKDAPRALSMLRFQSLIRIESRRDLIAPLRRAIAVLGSQPSCDGRALAEDLYFWNEQVRNKWCLQYFGAAFVEADQGENVR
ncbi:MAG: type I-E CRISPR-associated protein Cse2/CasB [Deltaproteobacteria bacterium]|nr:type I-E CRISPR-associated protein Cse2/CasB [Deltaproteobacteria bacterium]